MWVIAGLGNPSEEYKNTRHNVGRMIVSSFAKEENDFSFEESKQMNAQIAKGVVGKEKVTFVLPEAYMNKSGNVLAQFVTSTKKARHDSSPTASAKRGESLARRAEKLVVVYDDLDLPLGTIKLSFGRGSGGHKGVESIIRAVGTKDFVRIRIGISTTTPGGKLKKPRGEKKVLDFIMGTFSKKEEKTLKKIFAFSTGAILSIITDGLSVAMNKYN